MLRPMVTEAPYGTWKSKITTELFTQGVCKSICEFQVKNQNIYWIEQNIKTGKRELYFKSVKEPASTERRLANDYSIQTSIHEYGGNAFHVMDNGSIVFSTTSGLYLLETSSNKIVNLVEASKNESRFSDFSSRGDMVYCVNEVHTEGKKHPDNQIVSINKETKEVKVMASGADFYAYPRVSPDGKNLAWMQWKDKNMPWDETALLRAEIDSCGNAKNVQVIRDGTGKDINYSEPSWIDNENLFFIDDSSNWWNVYRLNLESDKQENMHPIERDIGYPLWQLGFRNYAFESDYLVLNTGSELHCRGGDRVAPISTPCFTVFSHLAIYDREIFAIASGPCRASSLISIPIQKDDAFGSVKVFREARTPADVEAYDVSVAKEIEFESDGTTVSGYFYPPMNSSYKAPENEKPPVILMGHGGPTAIAYDSYDVKKQFFTSRGIAVFDVNYRGSTGFGREFRKKLYKEYGIVDRNDILNGAQALITKNLVDAEKIMMIGSSSGGFLILSCLISPENIIKAAVSSYGVADLVALDEDTHKFEQRYSELLVGKYPEEKEIFDSRNPINYIDKINTPIAFLHGLDDKVVPAEQSIQMYEKIKSLGVMTSLVLFEGEGHGFRGGATIQQSMNATYYFLMKAVGIEPSVHSDMHIVNEK